MLATFVPVLRANSFLIAAVLTGATLFALGAIKVRITGKNWFLSGLETLVIGGDGRCRRLRRRRAAGRAGLSHGEDNGEEREPAGAARARSQSCGCSSATA